MARAGTAWISIRGDFGPLRAGLVNAERSYGKQLNSMQSRLKQGFKTAAKLAGVGLAAGAAVGAKKAFREFEDAEKASRQTEAVLRSTGSAANVSAKQIEALASSLSQKAAIDDEAIQAAENLLLTFTSVRNEVGKGNDIFNQATGVITDMSVALGQDLKGTTIQVGKALQDPIKGLTALRRVGVNFNEQQSEQVKRMVESGRQLDAQKYILRELNKEFEGSAEAQATSSQRIKVAFDNLFESIGKSFAPAVEKALDGLAKFADDASTILNRKDLTASEKFDRIGDEIAERLEAALPVIAEAAGKIAPKIASAFVRGFIQAPQLVQLVAGAWIFAKARKLLLAFGLLGKQAGAAFSVGAASTTVPPVATAGGAAGGAAAGGAAAGGAAAGTAASRAGGLSKLATRLAPLVKTAGFVGVGVTLADTVLKGANDRLAEGSKDLRKRLEGLADYSDLQEIGDTFTLHGGRQEDEVRPAKRLLEILDQVKDSRNGITAAAAREATQLAKNLDLTRQQRDEIRKVLDAGRAKGERFGGLGNIGAQLQEAGRITPKLVNQISAQLEDLPAKTRPKFAQAVLDWAGELKKQGKIKGSLEQLKSTISAEVDGVGRLSVKGPTLLRQRVAAGFESMVGAVADPTSRMAQIVATYLEAFGASGVGKIEGAISRDKAVRSKSRKDSSGQRIGGLAQGGFIGRRGERGRDNVPMALPAGTAVANYHQQKVVERAERLRPKLERGGMVPVVVGRGERIYDKREVREKDRVLATTAAAGLQPYRSLREVFTKVTTPHYLARGGPVIHTLRERLRDRERDRRTDRRDRSQTVRERTDRRRTDKVTERFAQGGVVTPRFAKGGIVPIPGQPGESIHSSILRDVVSLSKRYKLRVTDGYAASGHAAGGEHPKGLAIDVVPGPGGSWNLIDKLAQWAEPSQGSPRKPFRWVGYTGDPNHGRGNHLHLSWGGGGKGVGVVDVPKLGKVKITGRGSVAKDLAQAGTEKVRKAAQRFMEKRAGAAGGDAPVGTSRAPGKGGPAANRRLGRTLMRRFWPDSQWRALAQLWQGESGWDEGAVNPSSGAGGIPQALPASKMGRGWQGNARQQINWGLRYIKGRYGTPSKALAAWQSRSPHWYARGGFVDEVVYAARGRRPQGRRLLPDPKPRPRPKRSKRLSPRPPARLPGRKPLPDVIGRVPKKRRGPTPFSRGLPGMEKHVPSIRKAIRKNKPKNFTGAYAETHGGRSEHETVKRVQGPSLATTIGRRIMRGEGLFGRVGPKQPKWAEKIQRSMPYQAAMMLGPPTGVAAQVGARVLQKGTKRVGTVTEVRGGSRRVQWDDGGSALHRKDELVGRRGARPKSGAGRLGGKLKKVDGATVEIEGGYKVARAISRDKGTPARLKLANDGESGPGLYTTDRAGTAGAYLGAAKSRQAALPHRLVAEQHVYETTRNLKMLNRSTAKGEEAFRELQRHPKTGKRLKGKALIARMKAAGYDGVIYPGVGKNSREVVFHNASDLRPPRAEPTPKYALGGILRRTALALVGEQGPELAKLPDGIHTLLGREGPEIRELPVRTRVFSHPETKRKIKSVVEKVTRVLPGTVGGATPPAFPIRHQLGGDVLAPLGIMTESPLWSVDRQATVDRSQPHSEAQQSPHEPLHPVSHEQPVGRRARPKLHDALSVLTAVGLATPHAHAQPLVAHLTSTLPTTSLATGGTVRSLVTNAARRSTDEQDTRRSSSRRFSSIFERFAKRTGIQAFAKGGFVRPDDDERDFRKKTGGTKPKGLKIPPGGPPPGKGVKWDATAHKWVRRKRKPKVGQLDFLKLLTTALETTIPSITDLIQSKQDTFDLTDEEFYPDERVIPRLQRERHNIQTIKDGSSKSFIDWSAVEQRKSEISQVLAESFRLIGSPFGAPAGVMETVKGLFGSFDVRISDLIAQLKKDIAELRRQVRENLRKLHRNDKRIETLDERIEKEQGKKKPDRSKIRGWREDKGELVEENKELRRANRRLTGESDPTGDLPSGVERTTLKGELGVRQNRLADADEAYEEFKGDRNDFVGASGIGGAFASQRNNIQQLVSDLSTLTTERISESVAPIGPTADEQKADQRAFLAAIGDLTKNFGPNFRRLSGFQRGGMIAGLGSGDKIPVLAEPGEGFINRRAVTAMGGPAAIDRINKLVPRFQTGGVVASPIQVTAPKGQRQMVVVKDSKPERQRPEKIVLHEYNGPVTQVQDDDPHVGSRYWAKELAAAI